MADEVTSEVEDWDEFPDDDPIVEAAEAEADDALAILRKQQKNAKHVDKEEREALGTIITGFLKEASPDQLELADIFLDGVTTGTQAKKAIDKIKARAAKLAGPDAESDDEEPKGQAFAPPMGDGGSAPATDAEKLNKKLKSGKITMKDFQAAWDSTPTGQWSYKD